MSSPSASPRAGRSGADFHEDARVNRSVVTRIATLAASRWIVTLGLWLTVLAFGLIAYLGGLAREGFPPVDLPIVVVDGTYFVDDPETVDEDVALPLHAAYAEAEGVVETQTFALGNGFAIVVEFENGFTSPQGAEILEAVTAEADVPAEAAVTVRPLDATKFLEVYDILVAVTGPADATSAELEAQADLLAASLTESRAISRADVKNLLTEGVDPTTGSTEVRQTRFTRVSNDATAGFDNAVIVGLVRDEASALDTLGFSDAVADQLDVSDALDDGYTASVTADFATSIRAQISSLTGNLLTGLLAVALVSLVLIGWRTSVVTALFMATVMLSALAGLWLLGYSLNTISLFGLILTLGLLVDDAIVISESLDANRRESDEALGVVRTAINRVGSASFSGTLTTVLVFGPMLFVSGVLGEFIRAIPATVIVTLLLSFVFSVVFIPAVARPFLLKGKPADNPVIRAERVVGRQLGRLAEYPSSHGVKGVVVGLGVVVFAFGVIVTSFSIASGLGFNIFPPADDADALSIDISFDPGTTIEGAQTLAATVDEIVLDTLGEDVVQAQYLRGNERGALVFLDLVPFADRDTKAPTHVENLSEALASIEGARITVGVLENGPPVDDFPFAAQIGVADDASTPDAHAFAEALRDALIGTELDKETGDPTSIVDAIVSTEGQVFRTNGTRQIEVRAGFDTDDLTNNLNATEALVESLMTAGPLAGQGVAFDDITFDFGQETDNQEDFASLQRALLVALALMAVLLVVQFRSFVQPLLIFLAIPFSFFGVFTALSLSGNPISFFVAVGFIALIGVVVNNTILLIDAANQGRRDGLRPGAAIGDAVARRFRPLVATTITTVVGLLPLALSDPFWEAISFTLIGGLISSTVLVLVAFPVFYLAVEKVRTPLRNMVRRRLGWKTV